MPPPPPRVFLGRNDLVEKIVSFAENLTPVALLGAGGIGKTSVALTVLHDDRIKHQFGDNCRFIRCDQFPASLTHFLRRLSEVTGAAIENSEDLTHFRPFLSSKKIFLVLDNAECILDPQAPNAAEIYSVIEELSEVTNVWLCITSRISIVPSHCETLEIPTLSVGAARDTFYRICKREEPSSFVSDILEKLEFHPLSITLLATVAHQNRWDIDRLTREWESRRTAVLQTGHNKSLASTIELSLASPTFQNLGPEARELLGVVAFFPQGINEKNFDWLFPSISNTADIIDKFCILSLTYRSEGFIRMLAPLRDYLSPKDPLSSLLLRMARNRYFARLSVPLDPNEPSFGETRWVVSEDVNIEHLFNVFTSTGADSEKIWYACANFLNHLYWHKPRLTVLGPRIEALPDDHPSKPVCLCRLSQSFQTVGNEAERKRLLTIALKLWRMRGDLFWTAATLIYLSDANRVMDLCDEGMRDAREALEIYEQLDLAVSQARCLTKLAQLLHRDNQLDAAEETVSRAINLLTDNDDQFLVNQCHSILGELYLSKGNRTKAIERFRISLGIASSHDWHHEACLSHRALAEMFCEMGRLDEANSHAEQAKLSSASNTFDLAHSMALQAYVWYCQGRLEESVSECLRAVEAFEGFGAAQDAEDCREIVRRIGEQVDSKLGDSSGSELTGERARRVPAPANLQYNIDKDTTHKPKTGYDL